VSEALARRVAARRRAELVAGLRRIAGSRTAGNGAGPGLAPASERCDLCGKQLPTEHRHLLQLTERQILCACESCVALRGGDPDLCPTGTRVLWLDGLELSDELWAAFGIPIGLAFFIRSSASGEVGALYPSPAGATECELDLDSWRALRSQNPILEHLEADAEALIVNRIASPPRYAIAPIDECYRLVGLIRTSWEGISGGRGVEIAVGAFFDELRERA
jgi:hypothetical protein